MPFLPPLRRGSESGPSDFSQPFSVRPCSVGAHPVRDAFAWEFRSSRLQIKSRAFVLVRHPRHLSLRCLNSGIGQPLLRCLNSGIHALAMPSPSPRHVDSRSAACRHRLTAAQGHRVEQRASVARPRFRFPEFGNAPEWKEVAIGDVGEVITGNAPATARQEYYSGDRLFVSPADISDLRFVKATKTTLSEAGFAKSRSIRALSALFVCIGSTIGKVAQNTQECATSQQINAVVASPVFSSDFIYYLLHIEAVRISKLAGRQAVPIINKTVFSSE